MATELTGKILQKLGYPESSIIGLVIERAGLFPVDHPFLEDLWRHPEKYLLNYDWEDVAKAIRDYKNPPPDVRLNLTPCPNKIWGEDMIDENTIDQFHMACKVPVAVKGATMPDGHVGYGLNIGGVLALRNAVAPFMVGVDISCSMCSSIFSDSVELLDVPIRENVIRSAMKKETAFGIGASFTGERRRDDDVMEDETWNNIPWLKKLKDRAWSQLGSSGSGNHFVSFGFINTSGIPELGISNGRYLTMISHSGSRSLGNEIAKHYTQIAMETCRLPQEAKHLAWLDLSTEAGQEYWAAMTLAGRFAIANHRLIHQYITATAGLERIAQIYNSHNLAWREIHDGEELIVHRKGATPAGKGVLGTIPGTMADTSHIVRGLGNPESLNSASHGAGRQMSRTQANKTIDRAEVKKILEDRHIDLISAGLDESPQAYKSISEVMAAQKDLVESVAEYTPRIVIMAAAGERPED